MNQEEYRQLCSLIWEHNYHYFQKNAPVISDYAYDQLVDQLIVVEKEHPDWIFPGSPTQRIGETLSGKLPVVKHKTPMLSLANTYSSEEIQDFLQRMQKLLKKAFLCALELKIDGIAISVRYEKGIFVRAVTRGNGQEGEAVTANVRTIKTLPLQLHPPFPEVLEVRGEVFMSKQAFASLNKRCSKEGKPLFANPRNAAGGSLKLLDPREVAKRNLSISFYGIAECFSGREMTSHYASLDYLQRLGLPVVEERTQIKTFEELWAFAKKIEKKRDKLSFEIDGIVIKVDDILSQKKVGFTGKNIRWAVAYKFSPEQVETRIREIVVQVGRTGVLTPVAELVPVLLAGSTITRATLHNADEIKRKDIRAGDFVIIEKGGDVIPKVVRVCPEKRKEGMLPWEMPKHCPACGSLVVRQEDQVALRCPNKKGCPSQELKRILFFVGKSGLDIDSLGEKIIMQLLEKKFIKKVSDLYLLTAKELLQLKNFKEKAVHNVLTSLEKSKDVSLARFIMALGIPYVGAETAEILAQHAENLEGLAQMNEEELKELPYVGDKVAESVVNFFSAPENQEEIASLLRYGLHPKAVQIKKHAFNGKVFVLTGTLPHYTREEVTAWIKECGGKVSSAVGKKTDFVLVGKDPGSKYNKAKKLGIKILSEEAFLELLGAGHR